MWTTTNRKKKIWLLCALDVCASTPSNAMVLRRNARASLMHTHVQSDDFLYCVWLYRIWKMKCSSCIEYRIIIKNGEREHFDINLEEFDLKICICIGGVVYYLIFVTRTIWFVTRTGRNYAHQDPNNSTYWTLRTSICDVFSVVARKMHNTYRFRSIWERVCRLCTMCAKPNVYYDAV